MAGIPAVGPNINGVTELPATATRPAPRHHRRASTATPASSTPPTPTPPTAAGRSSPATGTRRHQPLRQPGLRPRPTGKTITNNSGDVVVPCNKWDAEQLFAWGAKATTYSTTGWPHLPIVDYGDGRGNAPWGFAAGTGGPQSGYAWNFDWDEWRASAKDKPAVQAAMGNDEVGPWQRIKYFGSRISLDQAGLDQHRDRLRQRGRRQRRLCAHPGTPCPPPSPRPTPPAPRRSAGRSASSRSTGPSMPG